MQLFISGKEVRQNGGKNGRHRHDDADIGGKGVLESGVFRPKVQGAAQNAKQQEGQLSPALPRQRVGSQQPQHKVAKDKAHKHDLRRCVKMQQLLAANKGGRPNGGDSQRHQMSGKKGSFGFCFVCNGVHGVQVLLNARPAAE